MKQDIKDELEQHNKEYAEARLFDHEMHGTATPSTRGRSLLLNINGLNLPLTYTNIQRPITSRFKELCQDCNSPIGRKKYCKGNEEHNTSTVNKGYPLAKDQYITFNKAELDTIQINTETEVLGLCEAHTDSIYIDKSYVLQPDTKLSPHSNEDYHILRNSLSTLNKGLALRLTLTSRDYTAIIRNFKNLLVLDLLLYPSEVVHIEGLESDLKMLPIDELVQEKAIQKIEKIKTKQLYYDTQSQYDKQVQDLIIKKQKGQKIEVKQEEVVKPSTAGDRWV